MSAAPLLTRQAKRDRTRALHLIVSLPLGALVYAPTEVALEIRPILQISLFPLLAASGLWMWQGHRLKVMLKGRQMRTFPQSR